ncbi:hypothetical protein H5410_001110 [Solanum commersonii]|uniref:F-box associated domain-containing protein n=1 Tax=Solanum commersonii TaxID=4109 RepID=A0A9J6AYC0_SOLCO|nr:hypothetical protein H5410_001110 [Solanum commersonii]
MIGPEQIKTDQNGTGRSRSGAQPYPSLTCFATTTSANLVLSQKKTSTKFFRQQLMFDKVTQKAGGLAIAAFDVTENSKLIALRDVSQYGWSYELIEPKEQTRKEEEWKSYTIQFPSTWKNIQQEVIPDVRLSCTFCDGEILFSTNLKSGTLCLCYDVTRQSWRKLEIKGLRKNHCIIGICSYIERLVM